MNKILKLLIASDTLVFTGFGLISPIIAIYLNSSIIGGSIAAVGLMSAIFLVTKTIFQLLFSRSLQAKHRFYMVWAGTLLIACVPIIYILSSHIWHFYIAQLIYGIGGGLSYPAWFSLFASHLSKGKEGYEWAIYSGFVGIGAGAAAFIGSSIASRFGFPLTFLLAGIFSLAGMIILLGLEKDNLKEFLPKEIFVSKHKPKQVHGIG